MFEYLTSVANWDFPGNSFHPIKGTPLEQDIISEGDNCVVFGMVGKQFFTAGYHELPGARNIEDNETI